ncbi:hypothetical protein LCM10_18030 [Rossellomorea aquimaris]|uniref:hypothetical protein n=1 Tax=Rossellomorea aquimaris TaxID=189382 RepID=UPI001CD7685B|nr:hypothetical protein [Rossellomorea aquimaris]MCA1056867.1 hypothetical protein [Rossellomorea aquimaris]
MHEKELLDLSRYRRKKQQIAQRQMDELYRHALDYALKETNIREKVRAKMIFAKRFQLKEPPLLSQEQENVFLQWYLLDYKTINGQTVCFQFLQSTKLSEPLRMMGALLLTAAPEPIIITDCLSGDNAVVIKGESIIHGKEEELRGSLDCGAIKKGSIYFVRKVPLVTDQWIIGPVFEATNCDAAVSIRRHFRQKNQEKGVLWRAFLKEEAPLYIL